MADSIAFSAVDAAAFRPLATAAKASGWGWAFSTASTVLLNWPKLRAVASCRFLANMAMPASADSFMISKAAWGSLMLLMDSTVSVIALWACAACFWARSAQALRLSWAGFMASCTAAGLNWGADSDRVLAMASKGVFLNMGILGLKMLQCSNYQRNTRCVLVFSHKFTHCGVSARGA